MPTTATTTRAAKQLPGSVKDVMKAGDKKPRTHTKGKADPNAVYVAALAGAEGFHKRAFYIEMAVCLAFYAAHDDASAKTKKLLRPVYEKAGYDCNKPSGDDYKTVQRRISVASDLYTFLGAGETVKDWAEDTQGQKTIERISEKLEEMQLDSIQAVRARAGSAVKTRKRKAQALTQAAIEGASQAAQQGAQKPQEEPQGQLTQADAATQEAMKEIAAESHQRQELPDNRILRTTHLELRIPVETTKEELMTLAQSIIMFAATLATTDVAVTA